MKTKIAGAAALLATILFAMACNNAPRSASDAVLENILTRTSIRQYTDEPVSDAQIETLLRAGMAAPSARNLQPWSFVVVTDSTVRASLVTKGVNKMYAEAPCIIVVCGETTMMRKPHDAPEDAEPQEVPNGNWSVDCSAVTENILLAAHSLGLGAVWTACWPYEDRYAPVKELLGIPEKVMPLAIIPVGHPAEDPAPKDKWKPERIHYGRW